jgi:hypothetical protein
MLNLDKRINNLESAVQTLIDEYVQLPSYNDLDITVTEIFDGIRSLKRRLDAAKNAVVLITQQVETYKKNKGIK